MIGRQTHWAMPGELPYPCPTCSAAHRSSGLNRIDGELDTYNFIDILLAYRNCLPFTNGTRHISTTAQSSYIIWWVRRRLASGQCSSDGHPYPLPGRHPSDQEDEVLSSLLAGCR